INPPHSLRRETSERNSHEFRYERCALRSRSRETSDCPTTSYLPARSLQVAVEEGKGPLAVDQVAAGEELDCGALRQPELRVQPTDLGVLVGHPLVDADAVIVAAL